MTTNSARTPEGGLRRTVAVLLPALLMTMILCSCGKKSENPKLDSAAQAAILSSADLTVASRANLATGVPITGTLLPGIDVNIVAPYAEVLEHVLVREGEAVRAGQVLARYRVSSLEPAAAGARTHRDVAGADYGRMKTLFEKGAVSRRELDQAEAGFKEAEAQAALAAKLLDEATVKSPVDGVIARRFVQAGDRAGDGDPLFRLVNTRELEFEAVVPSDALPQVRLGAPVDLSVSGVAGHSFRGQVLRINPTLDSATRQGKVYVSVVNDEGRLAGEMFATGRVVLEEATGVVAVPAAALGSDTDRSPFVWRLRQGRLEKCALETGLRDELRELVEIRSGLAEGDTLLSHPIQGLLPGQPVQISPSEEAAASPVTS
jgi:membrane fusion protein (multidrug efflux system)